MLQTAVLETCTSHTTQDVCLSEKHFLLDYGGAMLRSGYIRGSFALEKPQPLLQNGHPPLAHKGSKISSFQMSCLALTIEHLTSIAPRLTLQSFGRRLAFAISHVHHSCLHHLSSGSATRYFLCWFVLLATPRAPLVLWASESQW